MPWVTVGKAGKSEAMVAGRLGGGELVRRYEDHKESKSALGRTRSMPAPSW